VPVFQTFGQVCEAPAVPTPPTTDCPLWPRQKSCWPSGTRRSR
jgi:hypothetical protein